MIDVHSRGVDSTWMQKRAAAGVFKGMDIKPEKDHSYIHLIAMGDTDYYGFNRNGDGFMKDACTVNIPEPEDGKTHQLKIACGNITRHNTFEKHARVYRNHVNKRVEDACGDVTKSAHNDDMHRVELIIKVANKDWEDDLHKLASGSDLPFSMSCRVPYDYCSFCGHKAANRTQYCDHAKYHMTEMHKSGHQFGVYNDYMDYFDISKVVVPADRIAYGLLKAASENDLVASLSLDPNAPIKVSGAELSEHMVLYPPSADDMIVPNGLADKIATLRKLSEIEKEIEAIGSGNPDIETMALNPSVCPSLSDDDVQELSPRSRLMDVLGGLSDCKISLSLRDFLRLILGDSYTDVEHAVPEAEANMPGMFGKMLSDPMGSLKDTDFEMGDKTLPLSVRRVINKLTSSHSIDSEPVKKRVTVMVLRGGKPSNIVNPDELEKRGAVSKLAERLSKTYAVYKLAFLQRVGEPQNNALTKMAVLQHYVDNT
jgi:hypothetical protein